MKVEVAHTACFDVDSKVASVFDLLADVPRSAAHFPDVEALVAMGDNRFRWEMKPISVLNFNHQVVYACDYVNDDDGLGLEWTPVAEAGNSLIAGRWRFEALAGGGTRVNFETSGKLDVPAPKVFQKAARPFVEKQFCSLIDKYHANLKRALSP